MSYASRRVDRIKGFPIKKNRSRNHGNATHNNVNQISRQICPNEHVSNEAPFKFVLCLFKINLNGHVSRPSFLSIESMNDFLHYNHIVNAFSSRDKSRLKGRNKLVQERSKSSDNNFCNDLCCTN